MARGIQKNMTIALIILSTHPEQVFLDHKLCKMSQALENIVYVPKVLFFGIVLRVNKNNTTMEMNTSLYTCSLHTGVNRQRGQRERQGCVSSVPRTARHLESQAEARAAAARA